MLDLQFQDFQTYFDFVIGIESASTDAHESDALGFIVNQEALSFGNSTTLQGKNKRTIVRTFIAEHYVYVLRTDASTKKTRIFRYFAPHGLTIKEAIMISDWHHKTHVDF